MPRSATIGVDTGGTFTDLVLVLDGKVHTTKTPSTPGDFSEGVLAGIRALREQVPGAASRSFTLVHSSTVATNALLERKGARVGLVTTKGFRDVLEIGRQERTALYQLYPGRPEPLVPRRRRLEVLERVAADGTPLVALSSDEADAVMQRLARSGVESVAITLLFSFLHPGHERMLAAAARRHGIPVSLSSEVLPEFREYERTSTTVVNAYVSPVMTRYLDRLRRRSRALGAVRLRVVQSNGGTLSSRQAGKSAVHTLLSGPAAGLAGVLSLFRQAHGIRDAEAVNALTFDMGGTSTDVSLVGDSPTRTTESRVGGHPVRIPMMDIHTVGAGGGSIARLDAGGALQVGPDSAGADPGPACYGRSLLPTVTDANVVLGRIVPGSFLDGRMAIDAARANRALLPLARAMGQTTHDAARDIIRIVNANMERALRMISIERGHDPRDFTLISFGGAGGLHACALAEALAISRVFVPRNPGVASAWGAVTSDLLRDVSRTVMLPCLPSSARAIDSVQTSLIRQAIRELRHEEIAESAIRCRTVLDMRYVGQSFELQVPHARSLNATSKRFHEAHARRYGYSTPELPVEIVTVRIYARGKTSKPSLHHLPPLKQGRGARAGELRSFDRIDLAPGRRVNGPALILEAFSTTWLAEGWRLDVDPYGHLMLSLHRRSGR